MYNIQYFPLFAGKTEMTSAASQVCTCEALILKEKIYKSGCPRARVCCHTSHHLTLWTVRNVSLCLSLDTFICQREIINTIISPMLALYSVNRFKMWLCLFISDAWISERPLICLFHYTLALCTAWACKELNVCWARGSDVRFVREQRYVSMSAEMKSHSEDSYFVLAVYRQLVRRRVESASNKEQHFCSNLN